MGAEKQKILSDFTPPRLRLFRFMIDNEKSIIYNMTYKKFVSVAQLDRATAS